MKHLRTAAFGAALGFGVVAWNGPAAAQQADAGAQLGAAGPAMTIRLSPAEVGPLAGEARFEPAGEETRVSVRLRAAPVRGPLLAYLNFGACTDGGDSIAYLGELSRGERGSGRLELSIPVDLATLASTAVSVRVYSGGEAPTLVLGCGSHLPAREDVPGARPEPARLSGGRVGRVAASAP
jgi:hypothetical protein